MSLEWQGFLFSFGVSAVWGVVFLVAVFFSRLGMRERDAETAKEIEKEAKAEADAGWTPLLS